MSMRDRLGMSWWNALAAATTFVAGCVLAVLGRWLPAIVLVIIGVALVVSARYARSGRASDTMRLHSAEFTDERDRAMGQFSFAVVGVVGLCMSLVVFFVAVLTLESDSPMLWVAWAQVMVLTIAWTLANVVAARRL